MKKILFVIALAVVAVACQKQPDVTAYIDDAGDCIFENTVIRYRIPGQKNPLISSGMIAELRAQENKEVFTDNGYPAVAASFNAGGSAIVVEDSLYFPHENFNSFEVVEQTSKHVTFKLEYPAFAAGTDSLTLIRTVTLGKDSYFCQINDIYKSLKKQVGILVAVGYDVHGTELHEIGKDYIISWEKAPSGDGMAGYGLAMPMTDVFEYEEGDDFAAAYFDTRTGRPVNYGLGFCWSKGAHADFDSWADEVRF